MECRVCQARPNMFSHCFDLYGNGHARSAIDNVPSCHIVDACIMSAVSGGPTPLHVMSYMCDRSGDNELSATTSANSIDRVMNDTGHRWGSRIMIFRRLICLCVREQSCNYIAHHILSTAQDRHSMFYYYRAPGCTAFLT